jgi:hypothetical protein
MASQHVPGHVFKRGRAAPKTEKGSQRSKSTRKTSTESEAKNLQQITEEIKKGWDETQRREGTQTRGAKGGTKVDLTGTRAEGAQVTTSWSDAAGSINGLLPETSGIRNTSRASTSGVAGGPRSGWFTKVTAYRV